MVKKIGGGLLLFVFVGIAGVFLVARMSDGPLAIIAGGPFTSGELFEGPEPDWSFVRDLPTVEFQLLEPARSRTTFIIEHAGKIYIPSGYMTTWWGKLWKHWPEEAEKDGRVLLRVGESIYERQLVRIKEGPLLAPITAELSRKYAGGSPVPPDAVTSGYLWLFELAPRRQE